MVDTHGHMHLEVALTVMMLLLIFGDEGWRICFHLPNMGPRPKAAVRNSVTVQTCYNLLIMHVVENFLSYP